MNKLAKIGSEAPILFAIFLDLTGFGMAFPDLQLRAEWFAKSEGISRPGILIGLLLSSYFLVQILASPQWGKLSDRVGRKPVLLICTALSALSMVAYAFSTTLWGILGSRVLAGLAAANVVVAQAYIADTSTQEEKTAKQGRVSAAILLGLVAGPAIGGELAKSGGNYRLGLVAATASTVSFLWLLVSIPSGLQPAHAETPAGPKPLFDLSLLKHNRDLLGLFVFAAGGWFVLACLEGTFGRLIEHRLGFGQQEFGWIFAYESIVGASAGIVLTWLSKRLPSKSILLLGYLLEAVGVGLMPIAPGLAELFMASTFYAIGLGLVNPTINGTASMLTPEARQGELFGLLQGTRSIGFLAGPVIGGALFDESPTLPYFLACAVALVVGIGVSFVVPRRLGERG